MAGGKTQAHPQEIRSVSEAIFGALGPATLGLLSVVAYALFIATEKPLTYRLFYATLLLAIIGLRIAYRLGRMKRPQ